MIWGMTDCINCGASIIEGVVLEGGRDFYCCWSCMWEKRHVDKHAGNPDPDCGWCRD